MTFLADENVPFIFLAQLRNEGYDILHISEVQPGIEDEKVLEIANSQKRILITFDSDFGELVFSKNYPLGSGLIYFRLGQFLPEEPANILLFFLQSSEIEFANKFSVISKKSIRQKPLAF